MTALRCCKAMTCRHEAWLLSLSVASAAKRILSYGAWVKTFTSKVNRIDGARFLLARSTRKKFSRQNCRKAVTQKPGPSCASRVAGCRRNNRRQKECRAAYRAASLIHVIAARRPYRRRDDVESSNPGLSHIPTRKFEVDSIAACAVCGSGISP